MWTDRPEARPQPDRIALPRFLDQRRQGAARAPQGQYVVAVLGWRGGTLPEDTAYNGFYVSSTGGAAGTLQRVKTPGIPGAIGRVSLDYSPGGATLWAIIECVRDPHPERRLPVRQGHRGRAVAPHGRRAQPGQGAQQRHRGRAGRPGTTSTSSSTRRTATTSTSGSRRSTRRATAARPGRRSARTGTSRSPCWSFDPTQDTCPDTTHPDQHAACGGRRRDGVLRQRRRHVQPARRRCAGSCAGTTSTPPCGRCSTTTPASAGARRRR